MVFEANLHLFSRFSEQVAKQLEKMPIQQGVKEELKKSLLILEGVELSQIDSLVIYGLEEGQLFFSLKNWLRHPERKLIFLEDDLKVLRHFLELEQAKKILEHPRVYILPVSLAPWQDLSPFLAHFSPRWILRVSKDYLEKKKSEADELLQILIPYVIEVKAHLLDINSFDRIRNFYENLLLLPGCISTEGLQERWLKGPIAICGAGPSLQDNYLSLFESQSKCIIMGSGTGMNGLNQLGIEAHVGVGIDYSQGEAERIKSQSAFGCPYFFDLELHHEALEFIQGPKLLTRRQKRNSWQEEILSRIGIKNQLSIGLYASTTDYGAQIAAQLGSNPILFFGVDLAYEKGHPYFMKKTWVDWAVKTMLDREIYMNGITTTPTFLVEAEALSNLARKMGDIKFLNCSKYGLPIEGIPYFDPLEFKEESCLEKDDLRNLLHVLFFTQPPLNVTLDTVKEALKESRDELQNGLDKINAFVAQEPIIASKGMVQMLHSLWNSILLMTEAKRRFELSINKIKSDFTHEKILLSHLLNFHCRCINQAIDKEVSIPYALSKASSEKITQMTGEQQSQFFSGKQLMAISDRKEGWVKQYYLSGKLYAEKKRDGQWFFDETGQCRVVLPINNGKLEGEVKFFYGNGSLQYRSNYKAGLKDGPFAYYLQNGEIREEGDYHQGVPVGIFKRRLSDGNYKSFVLDKVKREHLYDEIQFLLGQLS